MTAPTLKTYRSRILRSLKTGDEQSAVDAAKELTQALEAGYHPRAAAATLRDLIATANQPSVQAWLWLAIAALTREVDSSAAQDAWRCALEAGEQADDALVIGWAAFAVAFHSEDRDEQRRLVRQSATAALEANDYFTLANVLLLEAHNAIDDGEFDKASAMLMRLLGTPRHPELEAIRIQIECTLGLALAHAGQIEEGIRATRRALERARRIGDRDGQAASTLNLGDFELRAGRPRRALHWLRLARELGEADRAQVVHANYLLATALHQLNRLDEALESLDAAVDVARRLPDRRQQAILRADRGGLLLELGRTRQAITQLRAAIGIFDIVEDRQWLIRTSWNLARCLDALGQSAEAAEVLEEALRAADSPDERSELLLETIRLHLVAEHGDAATRVAEEFLSRPVDDRSVWVRSVLFAAELLRRTEPNHAARLLSTALDRVRRWKDPEIACQIVIDLGVLRAEQGDNRAAVGLFRRATHLASQTEDRVLAARAYANLGEALLRLGRPPDALPVLETAFELFEQLGDRTDIGDAHVSMGRALVQLGRIDDAEAEFGVALGDPAVSDLVLSGAAFGMGSVAYQRGAFSDAARWYRTSADTSTGDVHRVEALAALLQARSAGRQHRWLSATIQQLVNAAQATDMEEFASDALCESARVELEAEDLETAASLFAIAVAVSGAGRAKLKNSSDTSVDDQELFDAIGLRLMFAADAALGLEHATGEPTEAADRLRGLLLEALVRDYGLPKKLMTEWLTEATTVLRGAQQPAEQRRMRPLS